MQKKQTQEDYLTWNINLFVQRPVFYAIVSIPEFDSALMSDWAKDM